jgi:hypothetical protein
MRDRLMRDRLGFGAEAAMVVFWMRSGLGVSPDCVPLPSGRRRAEQ